MNIEITATTVLLAIALIAQLAGMIWAFKYTSLFAKNFFLKIVIAFAWPLVLVILLTTRVQ